MKRYAGLLKRCKKRRDGPSEFTMSKSMLSSTFYPSRTLGEAEYCQWLIYR